MDGATVALIITAVGGLFASFSSSMKTREEVRSMRRKLDHETAPNHGTSLKDSVNRIESTQRGMARDIGRLADADVELQHTKALDHQIIHNRLDQALAEIQRLHEIGK